MVHEGDNIYTFTVDAAHDGCRLDHYLKDRFPWQSRQRVKDELLGRIVLPDARKPKAALKLHRGQQFGLRMPTRSEPREKLDIPILWEDDILLAVNKPADLPVHATRRYLHHTLLAQLRLRIDAPNLDLVHRLDRETSGVVLLTKSKEANALLKAQLREGEIKKEYLALIQGRPEWDSRRIDAPLGPAMDSTIWIKQGINREEGSRAVTEVAVIRRYRRCTLVRAIPHTGRQHQIRAHLAALEHPIVGDKIYGPDETLFLKFIEEGMTPELMKALQLPCHALHAYKMRLCHPIKGQPLVIRARLPHSLADYLRRDKT